MFEFELTFTSNITVATFSMLWGYKKEGNYKTPTVFFLPRQRIMYADRRLAYQANPWAGKILSKNNIPVAYKSDHPVQISRISHCGGH